MGTICLSLAPILRCQSLNRIQHAVLFIPPALEIVFSATLLIAKKGDDKKHLFLAAEGIAYAALSFLDLLTHEIPAISNQLDMFKSLDLFVGALSFIPLLLFTLFLFLFTTKEIIPVFPQRFQRIASFTLAVFPPLIVIFNQLGSLLTISYRQTRTATGREIIVVGFTNDTVRSFMDGLVLVLFVVFQALNFGAIFLRLVKAFLNQRQIDTAAGGDNEVQLFNGSGWVAGGIKLGAIEAVIGFAQGGFGEALTRRILRFLGRACLIIGVLKGLDAVEDFRIFSFREEQPRRRSALRALISNPRSSTFRQVGGFDFQPGMIMPAIMASNAAVPASSPMAASFRIYSPSPVPSAYSDEKNEIPFPEVKSQDLLTPPPATRPTISRPLVTIRRGRNRAPTLELSRISDLSIFHALSPFRSAFERGSGRAKSPDLEKRRHSASFIPTGPVSYSSFRMDSGDVSEPAQAALSPYPARYTLGGATPDFTRHRARRSSITLPNASTPIPGVRGSAWSATSVSTGMTYTLGEQFPGLPPRITPSTRQSTIDDALRLMEAEEELYPVVGVRRESATQAESQRPRSPPGLVRRSSSVKRKPVPKDASAPEILIEVPPAVPLATDIPPPASQRGLTNYHFGEGPAIAEASSPFVMYTNGPFVTSPTSPIVRRHTAPETYVVTDFDDNFRTEIKDPEEDSPRSRGRSGHTRIKSVGSAPRRRTPVPTQTFTRESAVAEWFNLTSASGRTGENVNLVDGMEVVVEMMSGSEDGSETSTIKSVPFSERRVRESAGSSFIAGESFLP